MIKRVLLSVFALVVLAGVATPSEAQYDHHHRHQVCHVRHHHRVCHWE